MASVDVVMPAPPPPPPAPVVCISRLALAAADAVVCLWFASLWVFHASLAVAIIGFLVHGPGCTGAAWTAVLVSLLFVLIVWPLAAMLLGKFVQPFYTNQLEEGAAALEPISEAVIEAHIIAISVFAFLKAVGFLLKLLAPKDPPTEKITSAIMLVPPFCLSVMCCLFSIPVFAVRVWRLRRHSIASVLPI